MQHVPVSTCLWSWRYPHFRQQLTFTEASANVDMTYPIKHKSLFNWNTNRGVSRQSKHEHKVVIFPSLELVTRRHPEQHTQHQSRPGTGGETRAWRHDKTRPKTPPSDVATHLTPNTSLKPASVPDRSGPALRSTREVTFGIYPQTGQFTSPFKSTIICSYRSHRDSCDKIIDLFQK